MGTGCGLASKSTIGSRRESGFSFSTNMVAHSHPLTCMLYTQIHKKNNHTHKNTKKF